MWLNDLLNTPSERQQDLPEQSAAWAEQLAGLSRAALWFENTRSFTTALLAAWQAGLEVRLLPDLGERSCAWAQEADITLTDQAIGLPNSRLFTPLDATAAVRPIAENARLLLCTSGSGGEAKIITKTAAQMCAEAEALAAVLPSDWRGLPLHASVLPQHLYGLTFRVFTALKMDWTIDAACLRYPEDFLNAGGRPCLWLTSPTVLTRFGEARDWARLHGRLAGIISAGGALPEQTRQLFARETGTHITDIYGSSETGVVALRQNGSTHNLLPQVEARTDGEGRLNVRSPWTAGEEALADTAEIEGRSLRLHGRSDRIIKLADKRISLDRLEHDLLAHEWVADAHCSLQRGRIGAWLALNDAGIARLRNSGRSALTAEFRRHLAAHTEKVALPRYWRFAARQLPRNSQAKIRAADTTAVFAGRPAAPDWQLLAADGQEWRFGGRVPLDLRYFSGHFAEFPLVAGVVQMQWAMALAARFDWGRFPVAAMENLKYQNFIRPDDEVVLTLRYDEAKGKIHFGLTVDGKNCASGRAVLCR